MMDGYRSLEQGQRVEFEITQGQKGPQAESVRAVA
jgi:CspA family cold shock protein